MPDLSKQMQGFHLNPIGVPHSLCFEQRTKIQKADWGIFPNSAHKKPRTSLLGNHVKIYFRRGYIMDNFIRFSGDRTRVDRPVEPAKILVAIDSEVSNVSWLASQVQPNAEVLLLDPNLDGVEQITAALERIPTINSLHIVSHGEPGCLFLGQTQLSLNTLSQYQEQLKTWSKYLQSNSLVLYGCQVAFGVGRNFLQILHRLTGANITASEQRVGNPNLGGNWNLNVRVGEFVSWVEEKLAFLPSVTETYAGVFIPTVGLTATPETLVEEDATVLTLNFDLSEPPPAEGIDVTVTSPVVNSLAELDVFAASFTGARIVGVSDDTNGFTLRISEQTATITLPVFDDSEDEGSESFTYTIQPGEGYEVDASASSATFVIEDSDGVTPEPEPVPEPEPEPSEPVVSFTASPDTISEADGSVLTLTFNTEGEIPEEGLPVRLEGDTPGILQQFTAAQTRFDENLDVFYRFDRDLVENGVTGGVLDLFALEEDLSSFTFTITEPTATIEIPVLDDILEEADQEFSYSLEAGVGYEVDPDGETASFTVTDGVEGGVGPTVSVTAEPTTLLESEQTAITVTFTLDEPPPPEGV